MSNWETKRGKLTRAASLSIAVMTAMIGTGCAMGSGSLKQRPQLADATQASHHDPDASIHTGSIGKQTQAKPVTLNFKKRNFLTVVVDEQDTIQQLARQYHVPVETIMSANNLSSPKVKPGQFLVIPI